MLNTQGLPPALAAVFARAADDQLRAARLTDAEQAEADGWARADRDYAESKDRAIDFPEVA